MSDTVARLLLRWRFLTSFILVAIAVWLSTAMGTFTFNTDFRMFFDADDPLLVSYESMEKEFTQSYTQVFILETKTGDLFTAERLAAIQSLSDDTWRIPFVTRVISIANHQHTSADGDDLWVEELFDEPEKYDAATLARVKNIILNEPELQNRVIDDRGQIALVIAYLDIAQGQETEKPTVMKASRKLVAEFEQANPDIGVQISGQLAVDANIVEIAERDSAQVESVMMLCLLVLLAIFLRSFAAVLAGFAIMFTSVLAATGFLSMVYGDFNGINLSTPYIVYMMAILDAVHIISAYFNRLTQGMDKFSAMQDSLSKNLEALLITSLTTAAGFLAMNFADSPPFREFGNATAFGVIFAFLCSVTLLPAILLLFPAKKMKTPPVSGLVAIVQRNFKARSGWYLPIGWVLIAIMIPAALLNSPNHHAMSAFHTDAPIRVATEYLDEQGFGSDIVDFLLRAENEGDIVDPKFLQAVDGFVSWLEQQPEVLKVSGFHTVIKRLNKSMHGDDPNYYRIPDDRKAAAEYVLVYESSVPEELDLQDSVNADKSALRISAMLNMLSSKDLLAFNERALNHLDALQPDITAHESSSPPLMMGYIAQTNIISMLNGCLFVAVFVCAAMIISFRSVKLGLLCMIPNLLPAIVAFGICGLLIGEIDMGTAMIFSMTLGIVVDDTIHFVVSYRRLRKQDGLSPQDAVHESYSLVGRAIIITSLVLCIGYLIPVFTAELRMNVQMYSLTIVCIATAMIADLFFLPALLVKTDTEGNVTTNASGQNQ